MSALKAKNKSLEISVKANTTLNKIEKNVNTSQLETTIIGITFWATVERKGTNKKGNGTDRCRHHESNRVALIQRIGCQFI